MTARRIEVPFFRPDLRESEVDEVVATLRSGWLTTGPRVRRFEQELASAVGARHAVAVNSCTAALHLAVEALGLRPGQAVLVPTMTFAATAEVVRYQGAIPLLVDCDPVTTNIELADAARKVACLANGGLPASIPNDASLVGMMPVHVGGLMMDMDAVKRFAAGNRLWIVEDAAHALPAAWRQCPGDPWQRCGEGTASVTCFSFYANKTITTGEGGMAVTNDATLASRMRLMSLHGLSRDAWRRYAGGRSWDYRILAPGFKYNLTDIAAAIGIHQLARAETMRRQRNQIAERYMEALSDMDELELPPTAPNRQHSWHLFPIKLRLEKLTLNRSEVMDELKARGVACSVHWRPLHMHPYYKKTYGWRPDDCPVATSVWKRLISLPIFPGMRHNEIEHVIRIVKRICATHARSTRSRNRLRKTSRKLVA
jgi:perosamine synthetase